MRTKYRPRRATKKWMQDAPDYVLSVHDNPEFADRYTIYFVPDPKYYISASDCKILYLGCDDNPTMPNGISQFGEIEAVNRVITKRIKWLDLPINVREHIKEKYTRED